MRDNSSPWFSFPCRVVEVVDGDTVDVEIDLGFDVRLSERVRAAGIDTAEIYGVEQSSAEYKLGKKHSRFVEEWFSSHSDVEWPFILASYEFERGVYGRVIGDIYSREAGEWWTIVVRDAFDGVSVKEESS